MLTRSPSPRSRPSRQRLSLAVAQALLLWLALPTPPVARAGTVTLTGPYYLDPWSNVAFGPGDVDLPDRRLWVGAAADGSFSAVAGAVVKLGGLYYGTSGGSATGLFDGAGTLIQLSGGTGRMNVGDFGTGSLTISGGAVLDATADAQLCMAGNWCGLIVGASPGSVGTLTLSGQGTSASFLNGVSVATVHTNTGYGTPGGLSSGTVRIGAGAVLNSEAAYVGDSTAGSFDLFNLGTEQSNASVSISGAGATWKIANAGTGINPNFNLGYGPRTNAALDIRDGGSLLIDSYGNAYYGIDIGSNGASATATVTGAGSLLSVQRTGTLYSRVHVGQDGATGTLSILDGAQLNGGFDVEIGLNGGTGTLRVNGAGSAAIFDTPANVQVGNHGTGTLEVSGGAMLSASALDVGPQQGHGTVVISDPGSYLDIAGDSARVVIAPSAGDFGTLTLQNGAALNQHGVTDSYLNVGQGGSGSMSILSGAHASGMNVVYIGSQGGTGSLLIDGIGSRLDTSRAGTPTSDLNVGSTDFGGTGSGSLTVSGGGVASGYSMQVGTAGGGRGTVLLTGAGSRLEFDATNWHRLMINNGSLTVADGAFLDGRVNAAACNGIWCGTFLGSDAGADASLTVTGAGSTASLLGQLRVGAANVTAPPATGYSAGIPGGTTHASISVLDGGLLQSQDTLLGIGPSGPAALGTEHADVKVLLQGAGSTWALTDIPGSYSYASLQTGAAVNLNTSVDIRVLDGARLLLGTPTTQEADLILGVHGGQIGMLVSGGARVDMAGTAENYLSVGGPGAQTALSFTRGAQLTGVNDFYVGWDGVSTVSFDGNGSGATFGTAQTYADLLIGLGGRGDFSVTNGAVIDMSRSPYVGIGAGGAKGGQGSVVIDGAGSLMRLSSLNTVSTDAAPNYNPYISVGYQAFGQLTISNGGVLSLIGNAPSTADNLNETGIQLGYAPTRSSTPANSTALATVTGAGSRLTIVGSDSFINIARGPGVYGQLNVLDGGRVDTTKLLVGTVGGTAQLNVNAATLALGGQWVSDGSGAAMTVGAGAGSTGTALFSNQAKVLFSNQGSGGTHLSVGSGGGTGLLQMSGGASLSMSAAPGLATVSIGDGGSGTALLNAAGIDIGGGALYIARQAGNSGLLRMENNATLHAGYVGVGSTPGVDTGSATLIVNGSTLNAGTLEVGTGGYVGGNGTLAANIFNRGVFNPGNSPGTLTVDGAFVNQTGGRLVLEVASDGAGGYVTDHLLFANGSSVNFSGLQVSFHFLGNANPSDFLAKGDFSIDKFIDYTDAGGLHPLSHSLFAGASFSASADDYLLQNFKFTADGGAAFTAAAVPEPGTWLMLLAGLGVMLVRLRFRGDAATSSSPAPAA